MYTCKTEMDAVNPVGTGPWNTYVFEQMCTKDKSRCISTSFETYFRLPGTTDLDKNAKDPKDAYYYVKVSGVIDLTKVFRDKDAQEIKKLKNWLYVNTTKARFDQYYSAFLEAVHDNQDPKNVLINYVVPDTVTIISDPAIPSLASTTPIVTPLISSQARIASPVLTVVPEAEGTPMWIYYSIAGVGCLVLIVIIVLVIRQTDAKSAQMDALAASEGFT